jgi:hypothetical protein
MSSLTVAEKEHWKNRIGRRIELKIECLLAADPNFLTRIEEQAQHRALESLGLAQLQAERDAIDAQKDQLQERDKQLHRQMLAIVRHVPVEEVTNDYYFNASQHSDITTAIAKRRTVHEEELLSESETGKQVLRLREEKENLLDTVWLATSPAHIKALWQKVADLLGEAQTPLQIEALAIGVANGSEC